MRFSFIVLLKWQKLKENPLTDQQICHLDLNANIIVLFELLNYLDTSCYIVMISSVVLDLIGAEFRYKSA